MVLLLPAEVLCPEVPEVCPAEGNSEELYFLP